jgi:protein involved in polysaccharide export with SLBB domain
MPVNRALLVLVFISSACAGQTAQQRFMATYSVLGPGVAVPGRFPMREGMRLSRALSRGKLRDGANTRDIVVIRGKQRLHVNYRDVLEQKNREADVVLKNDDVILVQLDSSAPP